MQSGHSKSDTVSRASVFSLCSLLSPEIKRKLQEGSLRDEE